MPIWERFAKPPSVRGLNAFGSGLRRFGVTWPRVEVEGLLARACWCAGLTDFGGDSFREGLEVLVAAFRRRGSSSPFGRLVFGEFVTGLLVGRLRVEEELTRHPEILEVPVDRPLFVIGMPRSGTTLLHRLMATDPAGRPLLYWESVAPAPAPSPETYRSDRRIGLIRRSLRRAEALSPRLAVAHESDAESAEEDNLLHARDFLSPYLGFFFDVPDYVEWMAAASPGRLLENYRYARRQLQILSWRVRGEHWVLKSPMHQYALGALLGVYPDANIIVTHRDPRAVVASLASLAAAVRGIHADRLDLRGLGAEFVRAAAKGANDAVAARESLDPARFFDVEYDQLVADPIGTVRAACDHFGYGFTPAFEQDARRWLADNPRHRRGVHRYHLADFGLDGRTVDRHFAPYQAWLEGHRRSRA